MRCTGGRWGHGEDGGRKAARGQVTEAASVEEAEAWCAAAVTTSDVGELRYLCAAGYWDYLYRRGERLTNLPTQAVELLRRPS